MEKSVKKSIMSFQAERHSSRLARSLLEFFEDVIIEQEQSIDRALDNIPEEYHAYVLQANVLDSKKMERIRKRILDHCGNLSRDMINELNNIIEK